MGRSLKPGISFYRMDAGHITNKKVRLLYNEFNSDGYYIWKCLLDYGYGKWGYYFDMNDRDELELFALEYCKKNLATIQEVIAGCLRRGLFDQAVADVFKILTSDMMQETFLIATSERRAKGSIFEMCQDWLLLDFSKEAPPKILIVPCKNKIVPPKKGNDLPKNPQRREEKNRVEERKGEETRTTPEGVSGASAPASDAREVWKGLEKSKKSLIGFIDANNPDFIEPYAALWNLFAEGRKMPRIESLSPTRKKKLAVRLKQKTFRFVDILTRAGQAGDFLLTKKWFTFDWILENETNHVKLLEGNYDPPLRDPAGGGSSGPAIDMAAVEKLYQLFRMGQLKRELVQEKHCELLLEKGLIELDEQFIQQAIPIRVQALTGTNVSAEWRMIMAYENGGWPTDSDCEADRPHRERTAKKLALIDLFKSLLALGKEKIEP